MIYYIGMDIVEKGKKVPRIVIIDCNKKLYKEFYHEPHEQQQDMCKKFVLFREVSG